MTCLRIIFSILLASLSAPIAAQTVTAVCREPVGRTMGITGTVLGKGEALDEKDAMAGGLFTIVWDGGQTAHVISQGAGGGEPLSDTASVVFHSEQQISFLVSYDSSIWLYSLFPKPETLLITSHNDGLWIDQGGAINKSFRAACEISGIER